MYCAKPYNASTNKTRFGENKSPVVIASTGVAVYLMRVDQPILYEMRILLGKGKK